MVVSVTEMGNLGEGIVNGDSFGHVEFEMMVEIQSRDITGSLDGIRVQVGQVGRDQDLGVLK